MNNSDYQQELQLIHQLQTHTLSVAHAYLLVIFGLPLPIQWKLNIYHFFTTLPLPPLSPMATTIIILVGPILFLIFMYFLVKLIIAVTRALIPFVLSRFKKTEGKKKFLELTFPSDTSKSAYATKQLYMLIHTLARQISFIESLTQSRKQYSLEIVSTKNEGIRFLLIANAKDTNILKSSLLSYLPGIKIKEVHDYLDNDINLSKNQNVEIAELKLSSHFALPLSNLKTLSEHDPISYLTGNMTNLDLDELISFQVVITPVLSSIQGSIVREMKKLRSRMYKGLPLTEAIQKSSFQEVVSLPIISLLWLGMKGIFFIFKFAIMFVYSMVIAFIDNNIDNTPFATRKDQAIPQELLNPYEQELKIIVKEKIDQSLFESTIRILVMGNERDDFNTRMSGLLVSFGPMSSAYQTLITKGSFGNLSLKNRLLGFKQRTLSKNTVFNQNPILSTTEISDIYHFPFTDTTKTEDLVKTLSRELPAPLSLKKGRDLDIVFAKSTYGNSIVDIGLTDEERAKHVYLIGRTGSGKSTVIFHMASCDIQKGRGLAVIDPHGDLAEDLLSTVPRDRINDLIYFDPFDLGHPIGINLLELAEGLLDDELELEKELVTESVVSVFRRVFQREENTNAHRIEYILRNAIYTAFYVPDRTIFTVYDLLNNPDFRDSVIRIIDDENLVNFWKNEFGMAGNYQVVKMVSGVTAKVGRFLFSPTAKRILEQPKSTINFDQILDNKKILICNVSEGKLGEDTSQILGLTIISKIQQAALRRVRKESSIRTPFYLFVDEFQNFATTSFTRILSGGRKFGLRMTLAEQSTSQQQDKNVVNVILANTGTVICFATASPLDEEMMQPQFGSYVTRSDIANLPNHNFYIKMSATKPEEPFSGETIKISLEKDKQKIQKLIEASRKNYASLYVKPMKKTIVNNETKKIINKKSRKALPDKRKR